jgi:hypothetical protein
MPGEQVNLNFLRDNPLANHIIHSVNRQCAANEKKTTKLTNFIVYPANLVRIAIVPHRHFIFAIFLTLFCSQCLAHLFTHHWHGSVVHSKTFIYKHLTQHAI